MPPPLVIAPGQVFFPVLFLVHQGKAQLGAVLGVAVAVSFSMFLVKH
jgi:hypothetical protein